MKILKWALPIIVAVVIAALVIFGVTMYRTLDKAERMVREYICIMDEFNKAINEAPDMPIREFQPRMVSCWSASVVRVSETWQSYDDDYERSDRYRETDNGRIDIYDEDWNRKGYIRKEDDEWVEYDKDWERVRKYKLEE